VSEVLRLDSVWTAFDRGHDRVSVLEDVSLSVDEGEIVAVVGGGGQGKTTLIRLASGTLVADRGTVLINGADAARLKDKQLARLLASDLGVATGTGPGPRVTVREYIENALAAPKQGRRKRWQPRKRRALAQSILDDLGISECGPMRWDELSDWQRVLVELAQAVVVRPRLLLVDNIAGSFGLQRKQAVMSLLEGFAREYGCGVLMAASDHMAALRSLRVWQLHGGRLRLMADHTEAEVDADVIPLPKRRSDVG
jgi:ABC-type lipoprotein export system ATPase subunit